MLRKKLLRSSAALIVILLIFLTANLHSIATPKIDSGIEKLQRQEDSLLQGKENIIPSSNKSSFQGEDARILGSNKTSLQGEDARIPGSNKTSLHGEDARIPGSNKTSLQGEGARINPPLEEIAYTASNPTPFHEDGIMRSSRARTATKTAKAGVTLGLSSMNKTLTELPCASGEPHNHTFIIWHLSLAPSCTQGAIFSPMTIGSSLQQDPGTCLRCSAGPKDSTCQ